MLALKIALIILVMSTAIGIGLATIAILDAGTFMKDDDEK